MRGRELIEWIKTNQAEDLQVYVQYRDSGGYYQGVGDVSPTLAKVMGTGISYDDSYDVFYQAEDINAIVI